LDALKGALVFAQRQLIIGTAGDVAVRQFGQFLLRQGLQLVEVHHVH